VVVDRLSVPRLAVSQPCGHAAPSRWRLLGRRGDRAEVLDADRPDDAGGLARWRHPEDERVGERLQQLVRVAGVDSVRLEVARDVGASEAEVSAPRREVRRSARSQKLDPERRIGRPRRTSVICREAQRQASAREGLQDLGERELLSARRPFRRLGHPPFDGCHLRCTAFAYRPRSRESGSNRFLAARYSSPP
jgi:hypothetical protein